MVINPRASSDLALLAVMAPLMATNLRATVQPQAWALDTFPFAGAIVRRELTTRAAKLFWRHGERKGSYTRMEDRRLCLESLGLTTQVGSLHFEDDQSTGVYREASCAEVLIEISHQGQGRPREASLWRQCSVPLAAPSTASNDAGPSSGSCGYSLGDGWASSSSRLPPHRSCVPKSSGGWPWSWCVQHV